MIYHEDRDERSFNIATAAAVVFAAVAILWALYRVVVPFLK